MATDPARGFIPDPLDEETELVFADPGVRASLEEYIRRRDAGELGRGLTTREIAERLGIPPPDPNDDEE